MCKNYTKKVKKCPFRNFFSCLGIKLKPRDQNLKAKRNKDFFKNHSERKFIQRES